MNMYNNQGQNIGTKSRSSNNISMDFIQPKQPQANPIIQSVAKPQYRASPNFPNGMQAPVTSLKSGQEDTNKIGNFLQYRTSRRNADMAQQYDKMNMNQFNQTADRNQNQNQFISTLANTKKNQSQNRLQKESFFTRNLDNRNQQFNDTLNSKNQQFDRTHDLSMQKFQHSTKPTFKPNEMLQKGKLFDGMYQGHYTADEVTGMSDDPRLLSQVRNEYMRTGKMPQMEAYDGDNWIDDNYRMIQAPVSQAPTHQQITHNKSSSSEEADFLAWKKSRQN